MKLIDKDAGLQYFSEDFLFFHTFPLLWLFTYDKSLLILRRGFLPPSPRPEQHSPSALSVPQRTLRLTPRTRLHALRAHLSHSHRAGDPVLLIIYVSDFLTGCAARMVRQSVKNRYRYSKHANHRVFPAGLLHYTPNTRDYAT